MGELLKRFPAVLALAAALGAPAAARAADVAISPANGTLDASPQTQISILGAAPRSIRSVSVTGSSTGAHDGKLHAYSHRRGASFVPAQQFEQGERVTAVVKIKGRKPARFSFTIARLAPSPGVLNLPVTQPAKLQSFVSAPGLMPPKIAVLKRSSRASDGDVFLT